MSELNPVFDVERNYLIDYLTLSISSNIEFRPEEILNYRRCDENSEEEINSLFQKIYSCNKFYKLLSILKVVPDDFYFTNASNGFKFAITNDYYYFAFEHSSINAWGKKSNFIELKGKGCRYFESLGCDWNELIKFLFAEYVEFNCTRLDLAIDDFTNFLTFDELEDKFRNKEFTCTALTYNVNIGFTKNDEVGKTLYAGTNTSGQQLCIYDKKLERIAAGAEVDVTHWIRFEFRLRKELAKSALKELNETNIPLPIFISSIIGGFMDFKKHNNLTRIERCDTWSKWKVFLKSAEKHKVLNQYKIEQTVTRKKDWMQRSLGKFLSTLYAADKDKFLFDLKKLMDGSFNDLDKSHLSLLNKYFEDNGLQKITLAELKCNTVVFPDLNESSKVYFENEDEIEMMDSTFYYYRNGFLVNAKTQVAYSSIAWENWDYRDSDRSRGLHIFEISRKNKSIYKSMYSKLKLMDISDKQRRS